MTTASFLSGPRAPIAATAIALFIAFLLPATTISAQDAPPALSSDATLTVNTGTVESTKFTRYLTINGTVSAWQEVVIAPEVGGYRVEEVLVDVGDYVNAGQELVRLSSAILQTERSARIAALQQSEAEAINAGLALDRAKAIAGKNLLSEADLDQLNAQALGAEARLAAARAELEAAELRLKFAKVVAPDAGVISARNVTMGQIAQAGSEMLRLLRQNRVEWRGEVPESSLPSLSPGQPVIITSVDGREHIGTIRIVGPTVNPTTHNGTVYVDIESDEALRPGMFARGQIEFAERTAVMVPLASLVSSDGYNYVFVVEPDRTVRRQMIATGAIQEGRIEVLSGLQQGENIVVNGAGFLKDGDLVNVVEARAEAR